MPAAVPVNEMAETLCVLAGSNARNAAQHFGRQSYASGDVASAIVWSSIAQTLESMTPGAREPEQVETLVYPVPKRMVHKLERAAFEDIRFEDVDASLLAQEDRSRGSAARPKPRQDLRCVSSPAQRSTRKVESSATHAAKPGGRKWGQARPVRERVVKAASRRNRAAA